MAFHVPSHLDNLVPPPTHQFSTGSGPSRPPTYMGAPRSGIGSQWRGTFIVSGLRPSDQGSNIEIKVVAVEIEGNSPPRTPSQTAHWPSHLYFSAPSNAPTPTSTASSFAHAHALRNQPQPRSTQSTRLSTVRNWVQQMQEDPLQRLAMITFMPDRSRDPNLHAVNQQNFRTLANALATAETAAAVQWTSPSGAMTIPQAGGLLIYPSDPPSPFLVGVVFFNRPFPDFVVVPSTPPIPTSSTVPGAQPMYATPAPYNSGHPGALIPRSQTPGPVSPSRSAYPARSQTPGPSPTHTGHSFTNQQHYHRSRYSSRHESSHSLSPTTPSEPMPHSPMTPQLYSHGRSNSSFSPLGQHQHGATGPAPGPPYGSGSYPHMQYVPQTGMPGMHSNWPDSSLQDQEGGDASSSSAPYGSRRDHPRHG